jgi:putative phosphoribosyl transferase
MFRDRADAARRLAAVLKDRELRDPLVLGIPRGGLILGAVLAHELRADLDVVLVRKLRAPHNPEVAIGAVSEAGQVFFNRYAEQNVDAWRDHLALEIQHQRDLLARRRERFRAVHPAASVAGRTAIVTDDGIATGSTMLAALQVIRAQSPHELLVAVPVAATEPLLEVRTLCDDLICLCQPREFWAIGPFYADFSQASDEEVIELLREFAPPVPIAEQELRSV